jgi:hypothetical protein
MQTDLQPDERVAHAAAWLTVTPKSQRPKNVVVELRDRFGLNAIEACAAIREYNLKLARAS